MLIFVLNMWNLLVKNSVTWETTTAYRLISTMIKMDTIWWNLNGSVLFMGKTTTRYLECKHSHQSVHIIERWEEQIQDDVKYVGKLIYIGNEHNWLLHYESTTKPHKYWEVYFTWQIISTIVPWWWIPDLKWYLIIWWSRYGGCRICCKKATT